MKSWLSLSASDPVAQSAGDEAKLSGASALGCALAGYFAAAGAHAGVLLSPATIVLSGFGARRVLDGRCRQPGQGVKRPRGFVSDGDVPPAAWVGVPCNLAAAMVALAYDRDRRLSSILRAALQNAKQAQASGRVRLLQGLQASGAAILQDDATRRALVQVGGSVEGGALTFADLGAISDIDRAAVVQPERSEVMLAAPWADEGTIPEGCVAQHLLAVDSGQIAVAIHYLRADAGVSVPDLDVVLPKVAAPVMRGVTRRKPGSCLPTRSPVGLVMDQAGAPQRAVAFANKLHDEEVLVAHRHS